MVDLTNRMKMHKIFELAAVLISPVIFYIGLKQKDIAYKLVLIIFALIQFTVDLYLLLTWNDIQLVKN